MNTKPTNQKARECAVDLACPPSGVELTTKAFESWAEMTILRHFAEEPEQPKQIKSWWCEKTPQEQTALKRLIAEQSRESNLPTPQQPDKSLDEIANKHTTILWDIGNFNFGDATHCMRQACIEYAAQLQRDKKIVDWLATYWNSQATKPQRLFHSREFDNPTGSFRDAMLLAIQQRIDAAQRKESK